MKGRSVTPHDTVAFVFGDEFHKGPSYSVWRPGGSRDYLLIYTAGGAGHIGCGKAFHRIRQGDLLLYHRGAPQDYATADNSRSWHLLWAHFIPRPGWHSWLQWSPLAPGVHLLRLPAEMRPPVADALHRMIRACRRSGPIQTELAMAALEETILWGRQAQAKMSRSGPEIDFRIRRAMEFMTDGFKSPFRLGELSKRCGLSVSRFSHLFRSQVGESPGRFMEQQRLSHAARLLRLTEQRVGEIAFECGFADPFYFTNRFRRHYGMSPSRFRLGPPRKNKPD